MSVYSTAEAILHYYICIFLHKLAMDTFFALTYHYEALNLTK